MIYYELVEKSIKNRNNVVPVTELDVSPRDHLAFVSMFAYGDSIKNYIEVNGGVKGYNKEYHLQTFYFDIDVDGDLEKARKGTIKLLKYLYNNYDLHPDELRLYFSGGKGFHIGIESKSFGGFQSSASLPDKISELAHDLCPSGLTDIVDLTIYNKNRLFRVPNSKHEKSGLYKVELSVEELKEPVDYIKKLASAPRMEFRRSINYNDIVVNNELKTTWERIKSTSTKSSSGSSKDSLRESDFFKPPTKGNRNNRLFKQSAMLFDKGLDSPHVVSLISALNQASGNPLSSDELYTLVNSAKNKTETAKSGADDLKTVAEMVNPYLEYLSPSRKKLSLLFDSFSHDIKWKLRGKLIGVVGKDGTKKSLFTQNLIYHNLQKFGARSVLSNMEMGENPLMDRIIDRTFKKYRIRPSDDMEQAMMEGKEGFVKDRLDLLSKHYKDKLIVTSESSMTAEGYRKKLEAVEQRYGKVDFLVVDGFSMMGGERDTFQRQEQNSKKLKELAKEMDICVVAIFHSNASCSKHERRADRKLRGSDKQLDNVDATISLSLLIDEGKTHPKEVVYRQDKGYALMYNKRGSGNVIRTIYDFHSPTLSIIETDEDPFQYEVKTAY